MVRIANIVGSGDLGLELEIEQVGSDLNVAFTEYDPSNYHGLYVRLQENGPLITVYRSGKYIISGCSSLGDLRRINDTFLKQLSELEGVGTISETEFTVENVVCTAELDDDVDLMALSIGLGLESIEYEPEQFPGLIYRPPEYPVVLLVFANGKVVITGASDVSIADEAFTHLQSRIQSLSI